MSTNNNRIVPIAVTSGIFLLVGSLLGFWLFVGPPKLEQFVEIESHETAFLVPLEGDSKGGQAKLLSREFLESAKVAQKRISLPLRKKSTGRLPSSFEYVPTARVIKVSRTPVTREWTDDPDSGTSNTRQKLNVESLNSVGFAVGATIEVMIEEADTATFLYFYPGKSLAEVVDTNIRGFGQKFLSEFFGALTLEECKTKKGEAFKTCGEAMTREFKARGITITYFGSSEGLTYEDPEIQASINRQIIAEQKIVTEQKEKLAQDESNKKMIAKAKAEAEALAMAAEEERKAQAIRNQTNIERAEAEATAAKKLFDAKEAFLFQREQEIRLLDAQARVEAAKHLPSSILPAGSGLLFGLDTVTPSK